MTYFDYVSDELRKEFSDRKQTAIFLTTMIGIIMVGYIVGTIPAIGDSTWTPILLWTGFVAVLFGFVTVMFFLYHFIYWLLVGKDS